MSEQSNLSWVQRLKDESWEAELLVAAISIFGTFQLFGFVDWTFQLFVEKLPPSFYSAAYFIIFSLLLAVSILASMFIIHFMLRAYWVGLVGLNSVFADYSIENSTFSKIYMQKLLDSLPKLDESVHKADKLCSVIFAAAFSLLMAYGWIFASGTLYLLLASYLSRTLPVEVFTYPLYLLGFLIIIQSIGAIVFNLKRFHENEKVQTRLFSFSMLVSRIILGPFLMSVTQITTIFSSNFKSDKALVKLVLLFVFCGFGLAGFKVFSTNIAFLVAPDVIVDNSTADPEHYLDKSENINYLIAPQISSTVIERSVIEVFVPITGYERYLYKKSCENLLILEDPERQERRDAELACFADSHAFSVNGKQIPTDVIKTQHSVTGQFGIMAYLSLDSIVKNGYRTVVVEKLVYDESKRWQIPFYYAPYN